MNTLADLVQAHNTAVLRHALLGSVTLDGASLDQLDARDNAADAERRALHAVIAHRCADQSEIGSKAAYLLQHMEAGAVLDLSPGDMRLLLRSLIPAIE